MDIQQLFNVMRDAARSDRSKYHLTLGALIAGLEKTDGAAFVQFDNGSSPGSFDSYRGYYSDLSIEPSDAPRIVASLLEEARTALGKTYEGYKGGDFLMGEDTPLWTAPYSECGLAIVELVISSDGVTLKTKNLD